MELALSQAVMKALVVDDSRGIRMLLARMLGKLGFEVAQAGHGREAWHYLQAHGDTSVVLVDWNMPVMDGYELLVAVRGEPRFAGLRLMMVSSEAEMTQMARALAAGADEYVLKPFTADVIADKLRLLGLVG